METKFGSKRCTLDSSKHSIYCAVVIKAFLYSQVNVIDQFVLSQHQVVLKVLGCFIFISSLLFQTLLQNVSCSQKSYPWILRMDISVAPILFRCSSVCLGTSLEHQSLLGSIWSYFATAFQVLRDLLDATRSGFWLCPGNVLRCITEQVYFQFTLALPEVISSSRGL